MKSRILGASVLFMLAAGTAQAQVLMPSPLPGEQLPPPPGVPPVPGVPGAEPGAAVPNSSTFGTPGQVVISEDFNLGFTHLVKAEATTLRLAPAIDVFVASHFTLGGQIDLRVTKFAKADADTALGLSFRLGFTAPLGDLFAIWPRLALRYDHTTNDDALAMVIDIPFAFIPVQHFFIALAPELLIGLVSQGPKDVGIGLVSLVGGYFDW
jgi:hypothetical protein